MLAGARGLHVGRRGQAVSRRLLRRDGQQHRPFATRACLRRCAGRWSRPPSATGCISRPRPPKCWPRAPPRSAPGDGPGLLRLGRFRGGGKRHQARAAMGLATGQPERWKVISRHPLLPRLHAGGAGADRLRPADRPFRADDARDAEGSRPARLSRRADPTTRRPVRITPRCSRSASWPRARTPCSPSSGSPSAAPRPARWCRPRATWRPCARSAIATGSC
jgi:hypothetical protein